jgi:hypothetical protein
MIVEEGKMLNEALIELADELFRTMDGEEADHAPG